MHKRAQSKTQCDHLRKENNESVSHKTFSTICFHLDTHQGDKRVSLSKVRVLHSNSFQSEPIKLRDMILWYSENNFVLVVNGTYS